MLTSMFISSVLVLASSADASLTSVVPADVEPIVVDNKPPLLETFSGTTRIFSVRMPRSKKMPYRATDLRLKTKMCFEGAQSKFRRCFSKGSLVRYRDTKMGPRVVEVHSPTPVTVAGANWTRRKYNRDQLLVAGEVAATFEGLGQHWSAGTIETITIRAGAISQLCAHLDKPAETRGLSVDGRACVSKEFGFSAFQLHEPAVIFGYEFPVGYTVRDLTTTKMKRSLTYVEWHEPTPAPEAKRIAGNGPRAITYAYAAHRILQVQSPHKAEVLGFMLAAGPILLHGDFPALYPNKEPTDVHFVDATGVLAAPVEIGPLRISKGAEVEIVDGFLASAYGSEIQWMGDSAGVLRYERNGKGFRLLRGNTWSFYDVDGTPRGTAPPSKGLGDGAPGEPIQPPKHKP